MTQQEIKALVSYDKETGEFILLRNGNKLGTISKSGYMQTSLNKNQFYLHRLAFLYVDGIMPEKVDHKNQIRTDNRWSNLRAVTHQVNCMNRSMQSNNTSGVVGITIHKKSGLWRARTTVKGITETTYHITFEEAVMSRNEAKIKLGFYKNHA